MKQAEEGTKGIRYECRMIEPETQNTFKKTFFTFQEAQAFVLTKGNGCSKNPRGIIYKLIDNNVPLQMEAGRL